MKGNELFNWLVEYHCKENLEKCLPYMREGKVHLYGQPLDERRSHRDSFIPGLENELYTGVLLVANGTTLVDKLSEGDVIEDDPQDLHFMGAEHKEDFFTYLSEEQGNDGAHIYDGVNKRIARVMEFNNNPPLPEKAPVYSLVPPNFLSSDGSVSPKQMGVKTRLAIKMPLAYDNTHAYQIKRTPYENTGIGKVTHFGPDGLVEEFFFRYAPEHQGLFLNPEHKIIGVYRQWKREAGKWNSLPEEQVANPVEYFSRKK
ncbi:MAG: hypothetical protein Q8R47_05255 [Nanoarchaeota archaeon]|nr:hypothetical protein [Nanoarchaeota archaeon]